MSRFPRWFTSAVVLFTVVLAAAQAGAHFGMVIPSEPVMDQSARSVSLAVSFSHPFEMVGMDMEKPKDFGVFFAGERHSLLKGLAPAEIMGRKAWQGEYKARRPGVYSFYLEPEPYWEPAEDAYIIHYTKAIVPAFGEEEGWSDPVGMPVEIVPLTRPFGNYAGNVFAGRVLKNGRPLAGATVEVEYYNAGNDYRAPTPYHVTQTVTADDAGVFVFACPLPGWWGFAALTPADYTIDGPGGEPKEVELGGVVWTWMDSFEKK